MASEIQLKGEKKDLIAHIVFIKGELDAENEKLNCAVQKRKEAEKENKSFEERLAIFNDFQKAKTKEINDRMAVLVSAEKESSASLENERKILQSISDDVKLARKELSWINEKCISGRQEIEENEITKEKTQKEIDKLFVMVLRYEEVKLLVIESEKNLAEVKNEILYRKQIDEENSRARRFEFENLEIQIKEAIERKNYAEKELKSYTDQLYSNMNDWNVIRTRLETRFHQFFPELELPIS